MDVRHGRTERLAAALVARHDFAQAVRLLNAVGVIPMPLKGVLLQHLVYQDPADRLLSDADLLVPPGRFDDAVGALRRAGYHIAPERAGVATKAPDARLEVDVHQYPFPPGLYRLSAAHMFGGGRIDETVFGAVVVLPAPQDLFAHLIGNFAKGRLDASAAPQLRDFFAVASRFNLVALPTARHLERHGLARAARYTLAHTDDPFSASVLRELRTDRVGSASAAVARRITRHLGPSARLSLVAPHLVNRSLPRGVLSVGVHIALGLRVRLARRWS